MTDDQRWTTSAFVLLLMAAWQLWAGFTDWTSSFERALSTEATLLFGMALFAVMAWVQQRSVVSTYALMLVGAIGAGVCAYGVVQGENAVGLIQAIFFGQLTWWGWQLNRTLAAGQTMRAREARDREAQWKAQYYASREADREGGS